MHEKLLLILSPDSINSNWVKTEIANTRAREQREGVQMLFPVSIVPYSTVRDWEVLRRGHWHRLRPGDPRVSDPRLQQLEGSRFLPKAVRSVDPGSAIQAEAIRTLSIGRRSHIRLRPNNTRIQRH